MLKFIVINVVIAFLIIYLTSEILNYMKNIWTQPKVIDVFEMSKKKYDSIQKDMTNINELQYVNNDNITNNMKEELKNFVQNNIQKNSYKDNPFN